MQGMDIVVPFCRRPYEDLGITMLCCTLLGRCISDSEPFLQVANVHANRGGVRQEKKVNG